MRLKFYPNGTAMPKWPGRGHGDYPYMGRRFNAETRANEALEEPCEVESGSPESRRALEYVQDGSLLCANEETAAFCKVPFVGSERDEAGNWKAV